MIARIRVLAAVLLLFPAQPTTIQGYAARYSPGLHEQAARNHGLKPAKYMTAGWYRSELGRWYRICGKKTGKCLNVKVVDYAHPDDLASIKRRNIIAELNPAANRIICGNNRMAPRDCPVTKRSL